MKNFKDFITEETHPHKVFVRDYSNGSDLPDDGSSAWKSKSFNDAVKKHEAEHEYSADKGEGFKFKHKHQAKEFAQHVNSNHKDLAASHEEY